MSTIVAGRFHTFEQANSVARELRRLQVSPSDISVFFVDPPGQHASFPINAERHAATRKSSSPGALIGAALGALVGLAAGVMLDFLLGGGATAIIGASASGAYLGSLLGSLGKAGAAREPSPQDQPPLSGVMVAAEVQDGAGERRAMSVLRAGRARGLEKTSGKLEAGEWKGVDATHSPDHQ